MDADPQPAWRRWRGTIAVALAGIVATLAAAGAVHNRERQHAEREARALELARAEALVARVQRELQVAADGLMFLAAALDHGDADADPGRDRRFDWLARLLLTTGQRGLMAVAWKGQAQGVRLLAVDPEAGEALRRAMAQLGVVRGPRMELSGDGAAVLAVPALARRGVVAGLFDLAPALEPGLRLGAPGAAPDGGEIIYKGSLGFAGTVLPVVVRAAAAGAVPVPWAPTLAAFAGGLLLTAGTTSLAVRSRLRRERLRRQVARLSRHLARVGDAEVEGGTGSWFQHRDGSLELSAGAARLLGADADGGLLARVHPEDRERLARMRAEGRAYQAEYRVVGADGDVRHVREQALPLAGGMAGVLADVTAEQRREARLRRLNRSLRLLSACNEALLRSDDEPGLARDVCAELVRVGSYAVAWVAVRRDDSPGLSLLAAAGVRDELDFSHLGSDDAALPWRRALDGEAVFIEDLAAVAGPWQEAARRARLGFAAFLPLREDGRVRGVLGVLGLHAAERGLPDEEEQALLRQLAGDVAYGIQGHRTRLAHEAARGHLVLLGYALESIDDGVVVADANGPDWRVVYVNRAFERITGYEAAEILGRSLRRLRLGAQIDDAARAALCRALASGESCEVLVRNRRKDGSLLWMRMRIAPVRDCEGRITHHVGVLSDVNEMIRCQEALERHSRTDPLTGLANRWVLQDRLEQALRHAERAREHVAVAVINLDRFGEFNDTYGYGVGDEILRGVGRRLRGVARAGDTVARLGADHFVVVMTGLAGTRRPWAGSSASVPRSVSPSRSAGAGTASGPPSVLPSSPSMRARPKLCSPVPTPRCTRPRCTPAARSPCTARS